MLRVEGHERRTVVNKSAFENLKRVLRTVPEGELRMEIWDRCAIGYATTDAWFQRRGLERNFKSASRVFDIRYFEAVSLFTVRAGRTPQEVLATIDRFMGVTEPSPAQAHARRQTIIDGMLRSAMKAERAARRGVTVMLAMVGL
jgi:hypothetical protein